MTDTAKLICSVDESHRLGDAVADFKCECGAELDVTVPEVGRLEDLVHADRGPLWRYSALIPANYDPRLDDEGAPRVVRSPELEQRLGVEAVWLIDATGLGTGNFKDYEASVIASAGLDAGLERISVHSTGNTAGAYRHYCERVGLSCASYVPLENIAKMGNAVGSPEWPIFTIDSPYTEVSAHAKGDAARNGWHHMAPLRWKLQGKAALAWQIVEYCDGANVVVQTVAGGYGAIGMEEGFRRVHGMSSNSVLEDRRYVLFQPSDADGLGRAWRSGSVSTSLADLNLPADPYEPTLQSTNPVATLPELRRMLPASSEIHSVATGAVDAAEEEAVRICADAGIQIDPEREKSAVISLVGLMQTTLAPESRVAVIVSGSAPHKGTGGVRGSTAVTL